MKFLYQIVLVELPVHLPGQYDAICFVATVTLTHAQKALQSYILYNEIKYKKSDALLD